MPCVVQLVNHSNFVGVGVATGTWHDFPRAMEKPVVVMTMNSEEVVDALAQAGSAREMGKLLLSSVMVFRCLTVTWLCCVRR